MTFRIRPVESEDETIWKELFEGYTELNRDLIQLTWERLLDPNFNSFGLIADVEGDILGITHYSFQNSTWALKTIAISKTYLSRLMLAARDWEGD